MQALWTSWTGLKTTQGWLDNIGNNVANAQTPGYAGQTTSFADTLTAATQANSATAAQAGNYTLPDNYAGQGSYISAVSNDFDAQMPLQETGIPTDLAVQGPGFLVIQGPGGTRDYAKTGSLIWSQQTNGSEYLSTPDGYPLLDVNGKPIVKANNGDMTVAANGQVSFGGQPTQTLAVVEVNNPGENMILAGGNAYQTKAGATIRLINGPGAGTNGNALSSTVAQGKLAMSNVNITQQMTDMIQAQEMFSLNSEALSESNQMMQIAANTASSSR